MDDFQDPAEEQAMIRHRRRVAHGRTPDQQADLCERLQAEAMEAINANPAAYQAFLARNHQKRRADRVAQLEAELMRERR